MCLVAFNQKLLFRARHVQLRLTRYVRKYDRTGDTNTVECFKADLKLHLPQVVLDIFESAHQKVEDLFNETMKEDSEGIWRMTPITRLLEHGLRQLITPW